MFQVGEKKKKRFPDLSKLTLCLSYTSACPGAASSASKALVFIQLIQQDVAKHLAEVAVSCHVIDCVCLHMWLGQGKYPRGSQVKAERQIWALTNPQGSMDSIWLRIMLIALFSLS